MSNLNGISRRGVLRGLGAGALLAWSGAWPRANESSRKIVVVGAGLAGLAAADRLVRMGLDVTVLEAASFAGGRVRTLRAPFADGLIAEAGGDAIAGSYSHVLGYVRELGLSLVPSEGPANRRQSDVLIDVAGQQHLLSRLRQDPSLWPIELSEAEKRFAPFGLLGHYLGPLAREMGDPAKVLEPRWLEYDRLSLLDLLAEQGASPAAQGLVDHVVNANSNETVSALSALRELARLYAGGGGLFHIAGGNDRLPHTLAERLGDRIHYGCRLLRVARGESTTLTVERHGLEETLNADAVILTLPFTALRRVRFEPALPEERAEAIEKLPYTQVTKTYIQARRRFWREDLGLSAIWSDGTAERLFDYRAASEGSRALMLSWINGTGVEVLSRKQGMFEQAVTDNALRFFPEHTTLFEHFEVVEWGRTYCQGAYAHFAPGQMKAWAADLARPIGPLFFAGEHTEIAAPGMEGALISGLRAADQVQEAFSSR